MDTHTERLAWCAGFLDGEGYFSIGSPRTPTLRSIEVRAAQIDVRPLERLREVLGGTIFSPSRRTTSGNVTYIWALHGGGNIRRSIPQLLPYLVLKFEDARDLCEYAESCVRSYRFVPPEVAARRERIYQAWKGRRSR